MAACRFGRISQPCVLIAISALLTAPIEAANVLHRYTFNDGTTNDSVGTAHGTLFVPNNPAFAATFNAGRLDLRANAGGAPQATIGNTQGAFVEMPDGVFTSAVNAGTPGAISIEAWANVQQNRTNARVWSFGNSEPNGGSPYWGEFTDWVDLNGQTSGGNLALTTHELTQSFNVNELNYAGALPIGALHHVVATFDQFDTQGGANPDGTMRMYVNNVAVGSGFPISPFLTLGLINDVNNYLGRSQWGDPLFDGQFDEVAIYDGALTPTEVSQRFAAGPVPTPIPTFVLNRATGDISVENHTPINFRLKGYTVSSALGGLNAGAWESIADTGDANSGMGFDQTNIWTEQAATAIQLAESTPGNGGQLTATTGSRSLGDAWFRTPFEDLTATFTLSDGSTGAADVMFEGTPIARSDLNGDGSINPADWQVFLSGSDQTFTGQTRVQAYLGGDLNGDFANDFRDFRLFQQDYIAANGTAAFAALVGEVPEPAAAGLIAIGLFSVFCCHRRRRRMHWALAVVSAGIVGGGNVMAATPITYVASGDPGLSPDANAGVDDAWTTTQLNSGGSGSGFFAPGGIPGGNHWILFSYPIGGVNGEIQADHAFLGGPLAVGQSVRLAFANRAIAAGGSVGVSLTSGGVPVATFKYNGEDPLGVYRYDDAGGVDQNTGEPFAYETFAELELSLESATTYRAAIGFGATWTGALSGGPIDGVRVFNLGGGDGSDVAFDNMIIGTTTLVPLTLEVNKANNMVKIKGHPSLLANIDYYQIRSAQNGLNASTWNTLDQQNLFAVDGVDPGTTPGDSTTEGWDKSPTAANGLLTEYFLRAGGSPLIAGGELSLGAAYNQSAFGTDNGDLQFSYGIAGGARLTGAVSYIGAAPLLGDYDGNGRVEAADLGVWKGSFGATVSPGTGADGSRDGLVDGRDFLIWQRQLGSGGPATANAAAVPEPNTISCILTGAMAISVRGARRRSEALLARARQIRLPTRGRAR
jgi:hypothetical protein